MGLHRLLVANLAGDDLGAFPGWLPAELAGFVEFADPSGSYKPNLLQGLLAQHSCFIIPDASAGLCPLTLSAIAAGRIIVAPFDTGRDLPNERTRVATVHMREAGPKEPTYHATLQIAGGADGRPIDATVDPAESSWSTTVGRFARTKPLAAAGALLVVLMAIAAVFAPVLAPYDPLETDYGAMLAAPSGTHWLGTDAFGRDVLSRMIYGSRTALMVGLGSSKLLQMNGVRAALATALFRDGHLSLARSARVAEMPVEAFIAHLSRLGIAAVRLDAGEAARDIDTLEQWLASS